MNLCCSLGNLKPSSKSGLLLKTHNSLKDEGKNGLRHKSCRFPCLLKYFYSNSEGRVNICELDKDKIDNINNYFKSLNYKAEVDVFQTIHEYQFKYPNYFKDQTKITDQVQLKDFYYEMYDDLNVTYRVSFDNL